MVTVNSRATKRSFAGKLVEASGEAGGIYWCWTAGSLRFGFPGHERTVVPGVRAEVIALVAAL